MDKMLFFIVFILGIISTLFFIRLRPVWAKWVPSGIFLLATAFMALKIWLFPAPEMAVLGEIVYMMIFGAITIGTFIGGLIVHFWKKGTR